MHHLIFAPDQQEYPICFLVPRIKKEDILKEYITPFNVDQSQVMVLDLHQAVGKKKTPAKEIKEYITSELVPVFKDMGTKYLVVCDADYFKVLTKQTKVEANLGYVMDCAYGPWKVIYVPNYAAIFYDPMKVREKIAQGMKALTSHLSDTYVSPGKEIIKFAAYPKTYSEIQEWLDKLLEMNCDLTVDIEAFDLKHHKAGIGTISFCWSKHEGIAFPVDYLEIPGATEAPFGKQFFNAPVRRLLKNFFEKYLKRAIYHNISYDVYVLIYELYMTEILDTEGLLEGMSILLRNWEDTKLITYLATNSCSGNNLSLKDQAQEFAGNYAQEDIKDITRIPLDQLLEYNLVDGLSTWFTYEKHWDRMVADDQLDIYRNLFQPAILDIIQMQLTGLPVYMPRVKEVKAILQADEKSALDRMNSNPLVQEFIYRLNEIWVEKRNAKLKKKRVTLEDANETFNPNSPVQLQELLYNVIGLPVISYTNSKQPSTDKDTLKALSNHTNDPLVKSLLEALMDYGAVDKILTSVIPALENAAEGSDGWHYLFGNFNLGGTLSGRLSSSDPNLQNLPSHGTKYAKLVKSCFQAPPGWIFTGLDFNSLEDRISALTTKDPNKLKVYTEGYDGHSYRAYYYFSDQMPDIDPDSVDSINSIQDKYGDLRQESKSPTFALTYQGTYITMVKNLGWSEEKAKAVEAAYHEMYKVSTKWVSDKLNQASKDGYVTLAFGLRLRTPLLAQVIRGTSRTPYEAEAEGRTAGNALGQSWCLLNTRAGIEFMNRVRSSKHRLSIKPCAHIHDAQYYLVRDDVDAILFTNKYLVKAVQWQEDPAIAHDEVKLGGEFSLFWPTWNDEIAIPNGATENQVFEIVERAMNQRSSK